MDLRQGVFLCRAGRNFPNSQRPYFCPFPTCQRDHRSICADHQAKVVRLIAGVFFPGTVGFGCLDFLNPFAHLLAQPASCL